jgi:hypothetical protein
VRATEVDADHYLVLMPISALKPELGKPWAAPVLVAQTLLSNTRGPTLQYARSNETRAAIVTVARARIAGLA